MAAEQDPADAGYTQLVCGSSDEDGDAATDGAERAVGACDLGEGGTAADRLLHMLEADYHRCLEADRSARHEPGAGSVPAVQATVDEATSGGGSSAPAEENKGVGAAPTRDSETGEGGADRPRTDVSEALAAASIDSDSNSAAPAESTGRAAGGFQGGAFAQAVASSSVDDVRVAMAGISLPPDAWPAWARDVGEKELLDRLRTNAK